MNEGHHYTLSIWHGLSIFERFNDTFFQLEIHDADIGND